MQPQFATGGTARGVQAADGSSCRLRIYERGVRCALSLRIPSGAARGPSPVGQMQVQGGDTRPDYEGYHHGERWAETIDTWPSELHVITSRAGS
jgi:hypothetical protein